MRRIAVIGCSGAGKSTLARELSTRLGLPIVHLDAHYWRPGWVPSEMDDWLARQEQLFAGGAWVADGNFQSTLAYRCSRADTVVHLDFPRRTCLRGVFGRLLRQWGEVRDDMAPGCPERFDWEFLRWVWNFRRVSRPGMLEVLREYEERGGRLITLVSRRETARFLSELPVACVVTATTGR